MKTNFKNINQVVNCNSILMVDNSKWIQWYLNQKKSIPQKNLDRMVFLLQNIL